MSLEISTLIKHKLLNTHPTAKILNEVLKYHLNDRDDYYDFVYDDVEVVKLNKTIITKFNEYVCTICFKYTIDNGKTCSKCNKYTCYDCDECQDKCKNCIEKCSVCYRHSSRFYNLELGQCYSCNRLFCLDSDDCSVHNTFGCTLYINGQYYTFCMKKCIPYSFYREQLIVSLNRLFRRKKLRHIFKLYNLKMRSDSTLCKKYIDGTLDKEWTHEKVAHKMCEMKYLFDYCNMRQELYQVPDEWIRNTEKNIRDGSDKTVYLVSPRFQYAKENILLTIGDFPIVWPWTAKYKDIHKQNLNKALDIIKILPPICGVSCGGIIFEDVKDANKHLFKSV